MDEIATGVRSDVAVKLFGDDFDELVATARSIEQVLTTVDGSADVSADQLTGQPVLQVKIKQDEIARYGIPASTVLDLVESIGGMGRRRRLRGGSFVFHWSCVYQKRIEPTQKQSQTFS